MKEVYFKNVNSVGDLYLERVLNVFEDENIVFLCTDKKSNYYFCVCYEFRFKLKWIISKVNIHDLILVLTKSKDMNSVFADSDLLISIIFDGDNEYSDIVTYDSLDEQIYPTKGLLLKEDCDLSYYIFDLCYDYIVPKKNALSNVIEYSLDNISDNTVSYSTKCCMGQSCGFMYNLCYGQQQTTYLDINLNDAA